MSASVKLCSPTDSNACVRPGMSAAILALTLGWPAMVVLLTGIGFWLGLSITSYHLWAALFLAMLGAFAVAPDLKAGFRAAAAFSLLMVLAALSVGQLYDLSFDGQVYHIPGVIALADGWNPIREPTLSQWNSEFERSLGPVVYVQHYAKGAWIFSAAMYKSLGNLELGKVLNVLLIFSAFTVACLFFAREGWSKVMGGGMALAVALNPVAVYQASTFYVDGALASLFSIILFLSLDYMRRPNRASLLLLACSVLLIVEIKFTGLVYAIFLIGGLLALAWPSKGTRVVLAYAGYMGAVGLIGVLIVGYQPYVTNTLGHGHPFYPALGRDSEENVISTQAPAEFISQNRFEKLLRSTLARSDNEAIASKTPFITYRSELETFSGADIRYGGFGPLFSGILLLSLVAVLLSIRKVPSSVAKTALALAGILLGTVIVNPEAWWARLSPQLWLLPLMLAAVPFFSARAWHHYLSGLVIFLAVASSILIGAINFAYAQDRSSALKNIVATLKAESAQHPVPLYLSDAFRVTTERRLAIADVPFTSVGAVSCAPRHRLVHILKYCPHDFVYTP